ncbi:MAG: endonuclease NucS, partial [Alphaproteobacteria bacterium]|nr:endonuclease NucS [Alphaproteobacteria bacterium]
DNRHDFYENFGRKHIEGKNPSNMTHRVCKEIKENDIVLCPDGKGLYWVGKVTGDYFYNPQKGNFRHRRPVEWLDKIDKADISLELKKSLYSQYTAVNITKFADEIEKLLAGIVEAGSQVDDETVEFALEKHLEDFICKNWSNTDLAKNYDIFKDENGIGRQFKTNTGWIDILAISKGKGEKEFLVIELKKGQASDKVVGQVLRYMGDVRTELAKKGEVVKGCIIAFENDLKIERALSVVNNIEFYRYEVDFRLFKNEI